MAFVYGRSSGENAAFLFEAEMEIREYNPSDEEKVVSLWREVFAYDAPHTEPVVVIRKKLDCQADLFFVAIVDGSVVGTVMGGYDGHRGWVYTLAVLPDFRHKGIGAALMRRVEGALQDRGCPKVNLQIHAHNTDVVAFYEAIGYKVEHRVSMGKLLTASDVEDSKT